jgi:hypothetical protein
VLHHEGCRHRANNASTIEKERTDVAKSSWARAHRQFADNNIPQALGLAYRLRLLKGAGIRSLVDEGSRELEVEL